MDDKDIQEQAEKMVAEARKKNKDPDFVVIGYDYHKGMFGDLVQGTSGVNTPPTVISPNKPIVVVKGKVLKLGYHAKRAADNLY